ncbi:unnamed protein product [Eretmochelys imbricata]
MGQQESLPQKIPHREKFPSAPSWVQGGFCIWVGAAFTKPSSVVSLVLQNSSINHQPSPQQVWHFTPPGQETWLHVSHEVRHRNKTPKSSTHPPATGIWGLLPPSLSLSLCIRIQPPFLFNPSNHPLPPRLRMALLQEQVLCLSSLCRGVGLS